MIGKLDHSMSDSSLGAFYAGGYTEGVVAYAYRPVRHDRLNVLAKYTYFYNVPTTDQVTIQNTAVEFIQKSHIAALDLSYDLTVNWSLGGKYAYRLGQASLDRSQLIGFLARSSDFFVLRDGISHLEAKTSLFGALPLVHDGAYLNVFLGMTSSYPEIYETTAVICRRP